jgi:hypothetical protein
MITVGFMRYATETHRDHEVQASRGGQAVWAAGEAASGSAPRAGPGAGGGAAGVTSMSAQVSIRATTNPQ